MLLLRIFDRKERNSSEFSINAYKKLPEQCLQKSKSEYK